MRKIYSIALCLLLCSAFVIVNIGTAIAYEAGYELTEYFGVEPLTVDGKWTTDAEWRATVTNYMGTPQMGLFEYELDSSTGTYAPAFLVEFADSTPDAGDIIQVCMNGGTDGTAPAAGEDYKIELQGLTTLKVYTGTGSGWAETSAGEAVAAAATITTSPHDPANHVVAEFWIDKGALAAWGANPPPENVRVAMYDASTGQWTAWPPASSADNPSTWGQINDYSMDPAPEGLTIGLMLALSSVAAVVSIRYFRKPTKP